MFIYVEVVLVFLTIGLLGKTLSISPPDEFSVLETLSHLISNRSSHLPWIPSIAYETKPMDEYQQRQFIKDQKYESQIELILAELQAYLLSTTEAQEFFKRATAYGLPSSDNLKFYENFILSYDNRYKQPVWALEHLTQRLFNRTVIRHSRRSKFYDDMTLHEYFRAGHLDYWKCFFDRGQFAPACDNKIKQKFFDRSYLYSNTAPRTTTINREKCVWDRLESYVAFLAWRTRNVYAVTGALHKPNKNNRNLRYRVIGRNRIAVPTHYYKVLLYQDNNGHLLLEAYAVPNSMQIKVYEGLEQFRVNAEDLDNLEGLTGLRFFNLLDKSSIIKPTRLQYGFREKLREV